MGEKKIFGRKETRELYATYGPADRYSGKFNPLIRNLVTGAVSNQTHHCERCAKQMSPSCYELPNAHYGYCTEWINRGERRERCGERFAVHSAGCLTHPSTQGYNSAFYRASSGKEVDMEEFGDDEVLKSTTEVAQDDRKLQFEREKFSEALEQLQKELGCMPTYCWSMYYDARAKETEIERQAKQALSSSSEEEEEAKPNQPQGLAKTGKCGKTKNAKITKKTNRFTDKETEQAFKQAKTYAPRRTKKFVSNIFNRKPKQIEKITISVAVEVPEEDLVARTIRAIRERYQLEGEL